ncbi:helix-turn-helix domain-containing protein [Streptomyces sp. NPDC018019]|uniref:helix-turn-helix domain-containing protein n=1 Tax=Streptomyces sp. NPDC018019 TaxID=3365030 RepID=UPI0037A73A83
MPSPTPDALDAVLAELGDSFTVSEVAALLDVHPATIYRAVKAGRLRAVSRGSGRIRRTLTKIPRDAVVEFVNRPPTPSEVAS